MAVRHASMIQTSSRLDLKRNRGSQAVRTEIHLFGTPPCKVQPFDSTSLKRPHDLVKNPSFPSLPILQGDSRTIEKAAVCEFTLLLMLLGAFVESCSHRSARSGSLSLCWKRFDGFGVPEL